MQIAYMKRLRPICNGGGERSLRLPRDLHSGRTGVEGGGGGRRGRGDGRPAGVQAPHCFIPMFTTGDPRCPDPFLNSGTLTVSRRTFLLDVESLSRLPRALGDYGRGGLFGFSSYLLLSVSLSLSSFLGLSP